MHFSCGQSSNSPPRREIPLHEGAPQADDGSINACCCGRSLGGRSAWLAGWTLILTLISQAAPTIFVTQAPTGEILPEEEIRIQVAAGPGARLALPCSLRTGTVPRGDMLEGHEGRIRRFTFSPAPDSGSGVFAFRAGEPPDSLSASPQLGPGFHYLVPACGDSGAHGPEIPLWAVTGRAAVIVTPKAGEPSSHPLISWSPVPGVPAYHVLLSDQPIDIDPEGGGVSGASIIWQAITAATSIAYGQPDPSGIFSHLPPPPLSPGVEYSLVVLNNYDGRSSLASSTKSQALRLFTLAESGNGLSPPGNLSPAGGTRLSYPADSLITFRWTRSSDGSGRSANTYRLFLYAVETQDKTRILVPVWQTELTDTSASLDAAGTLLDGRYVFKVFAMDASGGSRVGDTTSFAYAVGSQALRLSALGPGDGGDTVRLKDVKVDIRPLEGGLDPLPVFTLENGPVERHLPLGAYDLAFGKNGHLSRWLRITLGEQGPAEAAPFLPEAPARLTGRVLDETGTPLSQAEVRSVGVDGTEAATRTDAQGAYLLGVTPGAHSLAASKAGYRASRDTVVAAEQGGSLHLGDLELKRLTTVLSGTARNHEGAPLPDCRVDILSGAGEAVQTLKTDGQGAFAARLPRGTYRVRVSRAGFGTVEKPAELHENAALAFRLSPGASILKGRILQRIRTAPGQESVTPLPGALVEIADASGGSLAMHADAQGLFSFSVGQGSYRLKASLSGKVMPDSTLLETGAGRATLTRDLALRRLARVEGMLGFAEDGPENLEGLQVTLAGLGGSSFFAALPVAASGEGLAFSFADVPDGNYLLSGGLPGYGPSDEPQVAVNMGVWRTGLTLMLEPAQKSVTFLLRDNGEAAGGSVHLRAPVAAVIPAGGNLSPAPAGTYLFSALPEKASLLTLHGRLQLSPGGAAETTFTLDLPFSHRSPDTARLEDGAVELVLSAGAPFDSAEILFGYGEPDSRLRLIRPSSFPAQVGVTPRPGKGGGTLAYYFRVHSGARLYSNENPARRFRVQVLPGRELAHVEIVQGDSLRVPLDAALVLMVRAFDAAGASLDGELERRGKTDWKLGRLSPLKPGRARRREFPLQSPRRFPGGGSSAGASLRVGVRPDWDTLIATVTLDGRSLSDTALLRLEDKRVHRLEVQSSLGRAPVLPSPSAFSVFAAAFDTSTIPPSPVAATPSFRLAPEAAGSVSPEGRVALEPDFIGPLRVLAVHENGDGTMVEGELGKVAGSPFSGVQVAQTIKPGAKGRTLFHDETMEITLADSLVAGTLPLRLLLLRRELSKTFTSLPDSEVSGPLYELSNPLGASLREKLTLSLAVPEHARGQGHTLGRFGTASLKWLPLEDTTVSKGRNGFGRPALSARIAALDGNYYGVMSASGQLGLRELEIIPNPFSPLVLAARDGNTEYGTRISFRPDSDRSAEVTVSLRIFNMSGELVRLLVDHKTIPKARADFYWDGRTTDGRWARNGRYLLEITLRETGGRGRFADLKPVVLFR